QPPFVPRITLTLPVINKARMVIFLVSGGDKTGILAQIRSEANNPYSPYPAARVRPTGDLVWMVLAG
ncbi:MAG: 6-phosphogluconolactonase, partial [Desulfobacterota bacterium]|nr:6-phosphogluconolactonase [Thermodesulfobacteriota bacterium]